MIIRRNDGSGWDQRFKTGDDALNSPLFLAFMTGRLSPDGYEWFEDGHAYPMPQIVESARTLSQIYDIAKKYAAHGS